MKSVSSTGTEDRSGAQKEDRFQGCNGLDPQFADLVETIWACERQWTIDDRIDAAIKYGRQ